MTGPLEKSFNIEIVCCDIWGQNFKAGRESGRDLLTQGFPALFNFKMQTIVIIRPQFAICKARIM